MCYCDVDRLLGSVEFQCIGCHDWFHSRCLKKHNIAGVPFMMCYQFGCARCYSTESFNFKRANMVHMLITTVAGLIEKKSRNSGLPIGSDLVFLDIKKDVIPYMEENWTQLTSFAKRNKWEQTITTTISKYSNLFTKHENNEEEFALKNQCLQSIGPFYIEDRKRELVDTEAAEQGPDVKQRKILSSYQLEMKMSHVEMKIGRKLVRHPLTNGSHRYFFAEKIPNIPKLLSSGDKYEDSINPYFRRLRYDPIVCMSEHDRSYQLELKQINSSKWRMVGAENHAMGRCSHFVTGGTWYFEVRFDKQAPNSHVRVGWAQPYAPVDGPVGSTKLSYAIRSLNGIKFHESRGKPYAWPGFGQGSVVGCLIHLPFENEKLTTKPIQEVAKLMSYGAHSFFEVEDEPVPEIEKKLEVLKGSYIEFFINGVSCGKAYEDLYAGSYYPAISLFGEAEVIATFGPVFHTLPDDAAPMSQRGFEYAREQSPNNF